MTWRQCNVKRDHLHQNTHENIWLLCAFYEFLHRYRWHLHMSDIFLRNILNNSYYTPSITYWMLQQTFTTVERVHSFLARLTSISQTLRSRSQGQICWYPWEDLVTMDTHVKYQSPNSYWSKVIVKLKVFSGCKI